uniref:Uncharacterized protein n=1 Tax=Nicotiana tabacum TaxID=4097 RepID=A0A1S3ZU39_TOBAC|nr:PREDICTED: putative protein TPRXL [Nicotiana tabacum]
MKVSCSRSPRLENKQPKRRRSSTAGGKNKRAKTAAPELSPVAMTPGPPSGPAIDTDAQPVETVILTEDDVSALWEEFDLVDNANSRSRAPIIVPGTARQSTGSLPSSIGEHPTSNAAFDTAVSHSSTLSASSPSSQTPSSATSLPYLSTLPPATSSPAAAPDHEEGSSNSGSEFSETEEGSEGDDAEYQAGENIEPSVEPSTTPRDANTSLPLDSGDAAV